MVVLDRLCLHKRLFGLTQSNQFLMLIVQFLLLGSQSSLKERNSSFRLLGLLFGNLTTI